MREGVSDPYEPEAFRKIQALAIQLRPRHARTREAKLTFQIRPHPLAVQASIV
jgi:hypothetical protein